MPHFEDSLHAMTRHLLIAIVLVGAFAEWASAQVPYARFAVEWVVGGGPHNERAADTWYRPGSVPVTRVAASLVFAPRERLRPVLLVDRLSTWGTGDYIANPRWCSRRIWEAAAGGRS
jgi:hypothetical protein